MSRNPYQHPMDEPGLEPVPRVSALAVSSLVFGLLCCIPVSGLIGVILGGASLVGISRAEGRLSGRGLAITGMILGLLGTVFYIAFGVGTYMFMREAQAFVQPVHAITKGDVATARQSLSPDTAAKLTDERAKAFADEVTAEIGAAQRMPKGLGEWIEGYAQVGEGIQKAQEGAPPKSAAVPLPVHFDKEVALVMVYLDETNTTANGRPAIMNVSVHTKSGKTFWLVPRAP